jgi:hypothetical protein
MIMKIVNILWLLGWLISGTQLLAQTVVKMDLPPQSDDPITVVALFDEEIPEGIPVVLGLMGYDVQGGMSPYKFEWLLNGAVISTGDIAIFTPTKGDDLVLNVIDNNVCSATTSFNLKVASIPGNNKLGLENVRIYPTVFQNEIFIEFPETGQTDAWVRIFDVGGKQVHESHVRGSTKIALDLESGVYFVSIKEGGNHKVEKIIAF